MKTPEDVVRAFIDAYNDNDVQRALTYVADDFVRFSNTTKVWTPMKRKDWAQMWSLFQDAFPGFKWEVVSLLASGDTVAIEVIETGTFSKPWVLGKTTIRPNGKSYSSRNSLFFQVQGGLIQNYRQYASSSFVTELAIDPSQIDKTY